MTTLEIYALVAPAAITALGWLAVWWELKH